MRSFESIGMAPEERAAYIYDWKKMLLEFGMGALTGIGVGGAGIALKSAVGEVMEQAAKEAAEEITEEAAERAAREAVESSSDTTRVGRWMSQDEYDKMVASGKVQMSGDNKVHVANPADINAFGKQASKGSIYVEFDVPSTSNI